MSYRLLESLLLECHGNKISKSDVLSLLHDGHFQCHDPRTFTAVTRLCKFYYAELELKKYNTKLLVPESNLFENIVNQMFVDQKLGPVLPITVLCREPNGELGELLLHEVAPKVLNTTVDGDWDRRVAQFVWDVIAKQSYEFFFLSHSPQLRVPPSVKSVLSMTPAQIEAKQRATRFLLNSAFANKPERMAALHKQIGMSPWKYMTCNLQAFGFQQGTIGYIRVILEGSKPPSITRGIVAMCDIKHEAMARAALFFDPFHEFLLVLRSKVEDEKKPKISVFVVAKALLSINQEGDVFQNVVPVVK